MKKGSKVLIAVDNWVRYDYPELKKDDYEGIIVARRKSEDTLGRWGDLKKAYTVRIKGHRTDRIFYDDEMELF